MTNLQNMKKYSKKVIQKVDRKSAQNWSKIWPKTGQLLGSATYSRRGVKLVNPLHSPIDKTSAFLGC